MVGCWGCEGATEEEAEFWGVFLGKEVTGVEVKELSVFGSSENGIWLDSVSEALCASVNEGSCALLTNW